MRNKDSRINDEIDTMATEKSAGIARTISSFSQGGIVARPRLADEYFFAFPSYAGIKDILKH